MISQKLDGAGGITRIALSALMVVLLAIGATAAWAEPLQKVEPKKVCMVNNTLFAKDQIPVEVDGKTYFGCCEMCKTRLAEDPSSRQAVDPVSGKTVDKSQAVIGAGPDGRVKYFESSATFDAYVGS